MRVSHLSLADWRNYPTADLAFAPGITVLIGPNGQGKTNLVEAVAFLSTLSSHRVSSHAALIRAGADAAIVRAKLGNAEREVLIELQLNRAQANVAQLNRAPAKPRDITRYCHTVVFAPEDLAIVRGDPGDRRRFVDDLVMQLSPRMAGVFSDYERVLKQRNNLLKTSRGVQNVSTLEIWNDKLVALGSEIIRERAALITRLREPLAQAYEFIVAANHEPTMQWTPSWSEIIPETDAISVDDAFTRALERVSAKERERGVTLVGPHRDELELGLNGLAVKGYASHGESWSFVLALKLAAAEILRHESLVGDPIIILDDVFAELDRARRERLAEAIRSFEQVLITAAVAEDVPASLDATVQFVERGALVEALSEVRS